ncbi:hypothetical protein DFH09DRAFT_1369090 [Mycena vulgaris]|nr:hypothetical protein DFH09DRAFT_1369090 [Mycena vulgaris]
MSCYTVGADPCNSHCVGVVCFFHSNPLFAIAVLRPRTKYKGCKYKQPILALEYPKIWIPFASSFAAAIPIVVIIRPLSCVFSKGINIRLSASETTLFMCVVAIVELVVGDISPSMSRPVRPFLIFIPAACSNLAFQSVHSFSPLPCPSTTSELICAVVAPQLLVPPILACFFPCPSLLSEVAKLKALV